MRLVTALMVLVPAIAFADEPTPTEEKGAEPKLIGPNATDPTLPPPPQPKTDHKGQFQLSLRAALGFRAIATYSGDDFCGDTDKDTSSNNAPVCTSRTPFSFDIELGYGVAKKLDLLLEMRFGLEGDFGALPTSMSHPHSVKLSPGVRYFFSEGRRSKLFTTGQVVFDFTGYENAAGNDRGNDVGIRNLNGYWFDLQREYGFYVYFGESATFARWFDLELEAGVGIQGRYP